MSHKITFDQDYRGDYISSWMGYEVFLGALVFVAGLYYMNHAFRFRAVLGEREAMLYYFLGMSGVGVGIGVILAYGFAVLPP